MKPIKDYNTIEEMEKDFNSWFGWLISGWDETTDEWKESNIELDFTADKIEMMLAITEWQFDEDEFKTLNKLNLVYWYCVRLLYLNNSNNDYSYIDEVYQWLDNIKPFGNKVL